MKCFRCENKMYYERFFDQRGNFWEWKCFFCGEIVDGVISEKKIRFGGCEGIRLRKQEKI